MDDGSILNIRPLADDDFIFIGAQHGPVPDGGILMDFHIASDDSAGRNEGCFVDYGFFAANGEDQGFHFYPFTASG